MQISNINDQAEIRRSLGTYWPALRKVSEQPVPVILGIVGQLVAVKLALGSWFETTLGVATFLVLSHIVHFVINARELEPRLAEFDGRGVTRSFLGFPQRFVPYVLACLAMIAASLGPMIAAQAFYRFTDNSTLYRVELLAFFLIISAIYVGGLASVRLCLVPMLALDRGLTLPAAARQSNILARGHFLMLGTHFYCVAVIYFVVSYYTHGIAMPIFLPFATHTWIRIYRQLVPLPADPAGNPTELRHHEGRSRLSAPARDRTR